MIALKHSALSLEELCDILRAKGVTYFSNGDLELELGPLPSSAQPVATASDEPRAEEKLRDDGLTAEEAALLYASTR